MRAEWEGPPIVFGGTSCKLAFHFWVFRVAEGGLLGAGQLFCSPSRSWDSPDDDDDDHAAATACYCPPPTMVKYLLMFAIQSLSYGSKIQHLQTSDDPFTHDIFQSTSSDSESSSNSEMSSHLKPSLAKGVIMVPNRPNPSWVASIMGKKFVPAKSTQGKPVAKTTTTATTKPASKPFSSTTGADDALTQLQGALASEKQKKLANT